MLSVIIVSYNVRYFLEQCLHAVRRAMTGMDAELIVVDNQSTDGTVAQLSSLFPDVRWVVNDTNAGFSRACNVGLSVSRGAYVLFLNPDTLVPEEVLGVCINYMETHPAVGLVGVPMLDGRGCYLPESKRAIPSPLAALYKLMGLAALFPRSGHFNRYALGNLPANQTQRVAVLAGAFLFCRRAALDAVGGFDERFFLYGEDIDLCYRASAAGWECHYVAEAPIMHFKGESIGTNSAAHVKHFYEAMLLFINKHFSSNWSRGFRMLIRAAVIGRATFSLLGRVLKPWLLPAMDVLLLWLSLSFMRTAWIRYMRDGVDFHVPFISYALPGAALLFVITAALAGMYERLYSPSRLLRAMLVGAVSVLAAYSLLPETLRFSRGVITGGVSIGAATIWLLRTALFSPFLRWLGYDRGGHVARIVVSNETSFWEIEKLLQASGREGALYHTPIHTSPSDLLAQAKTNGCREIVFCTGELPLQQALVHTRELSGKGLRFLFHAEASQSVVGSDWPAVAGRTISIQRDYRISQPLQQRMKRVVDVVASLGMIMLLPLHFLLHEKPVALLANAIKVLVGNATWIGYGTKGNGLPEIKPSVAPHTIERTVPANATPDEWYAWRYEWWQDIHMILLRYRELGDREVH